MVYSYVVHACAGVYIAAHVGTLLEVGRLIASDTWHQAPGIEHAPSSTWRRANVAPNGGAVDQEVSCASRRSQDVMQGSAIRGV